VEHIFEAFRSGKEIESFTDLSPLPLDKPVVVMLNTSSGSKNLPNSDVIVGCHWLSLVILPRGYRGLEISKDPAPKEFCMTAFSVFLYDSLKSYKNFPGPLKTALYNGVAELYPEKDQSLFKAVPPCVPEGTNWLEKTSKALQSSNDNCCGFWALVNSILTVVSGSSLFWEKLVPSDDPSGTHYRAQAGLYLRRIFDKILGSLHSSKKKVFKSKTKREAVPPVTSEFVLQHELPTVDLNLVASPSNTLISGNQIPLQPSINLPQVRLTKKGTPVKRLKSNRNLKRKKLKPHSARNLTQKTSLLLENRLS